MDTRKAESRNEITTVCSDHHAESRQRRQEWVISALEGGANKVHVHSKIPAPNPVDQIHDVQEESLLATAATLEKERANLQKLWVVVQSANRQCWTVACAHLTLLNVNVGGWTELDRALLPLLDLCVIRTMAADFSLRTTDGSLLRHFTLLSDEALHTVALLFACV